MGQIKKTWRPVDGILLLNKPAGLSSNQALQQVKHLFLAAKAGHTGSLDPLATGMLPICFGEATKFSQVLLDADKTYRTIATLGITTTTADSEGDIIAQQVVPKFTAQEIQDVLQQFCGDITQIPSMYSALKHQGQALYKLARKGIEIQREQRHITIYQLDLVAQTPATLTLDVKCSKGTYIRNLVEDIGKALGCGAHVSYLHRFNVEQYAQQAMYTLEQLQQIAEQGMPALDKLLLSVDSGLRHLPKVTVSEAVIYYLYNGQALYIPRLQLTAGLLRLYDHTDRFIGVGEVLANGKVAPKRLLSTN